MPTRTAPGDTSMAALLAIVQRLEQRVSALEQMLAVAGTARAPFDAPPLAAVLPDTDEAPVDMPAAGLPPVPWAGWTGLGTVTLVGRTLMALGGAYLLRALTEDAVIAPLVGVVAGFVYAQAWIVLCVRAGLRGANPAAVFHGLTAALIGFPLMWEAIARFGLMRPLTGAFALACFAGLMLAAARLSGRQSVAWFAALGGTATAIALAVATATFVPYIVVVSLIGIAALWLGYVDDWVGIRWPVAGAVNLLVLAITLRALDPDVPPAVATTVALQLFVLAIYLGSFVARTLVLGREVILFEVVQSAAVMAVGFGGALAVLATAGVSAAPLGGAALALGAATYAFAFVHVERRRQWRNLAFFTSLAVAFSMAGVILVLPEAASVLVLGLMALACAEWSRRSARLTLAVHAFLFAAVMAGLSGLLGVATHALGAPAAQPWPVPGLVHMIALVTVAACVLWPAPLSLAALETPDARVLRGGRLALLAWTAAGVAVALSVPLAANPGPGADAAVVATIRTLVLVTTAILLLVLPRAARDIERDWLAYAVLAGTGLKILGEDLPRGRPATLFVALAVYGAALILSPRIGRARGTGRGRPGESASQG